MARSTRCVLSRTAVSASPTKTVLGIDENDTSTSTSTGVASIPTRVYDASFASMVRPWDAAIGCGTLSNALTHRQKTPLAVDNSLP